MASISNNSFHPPDEQFTIAFSVTYCFKFLLHYLFSMFFYYICNTKLSSSKAAFKSTFPPAFLLIFATSPVCHHLTNQSSLVDWVNSHSK